MVFKILKLKRTIAGPLPPRNGPGGRVSGPAFIDKELQDEQSDAAFQPRKKQTINVILFGEAGVGKSAVVNLIAQTDIARVSSDVVGCTLQSTRYDVLFDGMDFSIFDTVGLNQPVFGFDTHLQAIESAHKLILELRAAGGIHLLLFCMRGGRLSMTTQNNYRLFSEFLCQARVPLAIVVTGLERETQMEDWWSRNKTDVERYGIKSIGHACITAVTDGSPDEHLKYIESQKKIRELLTSCPLRTGTFLLEPMVWLAMAGTGIRSLVKEGSNSKRRDIEKVLSKRLRISSEDVKKIIDMMEKGGTIC